MTGWTIHLAVIGLAAVMLTACEPAAAPSFDSDTFEPDEAEADLAARLIAVCDAALAAGELRPAAAAHGLNLGDTALDIVTHTIARPAETARAPDLPELEIWLAVEEDGPACLIGTNARHREVMAVWSVLMDARRDPGAYTVASEWFGWWPFRQETLYSAVAIRPS